MAPVLYWKGNDNGHWSIIHIPMKLPQRFCSNLARDLWKYYDLNNTLILRLIWWGRRRKRRRINNNEKEDDSIWRRWFTASRDIHREPLGALWTENVSHVWTSKIMQSGKYHPISDCKYFMTKALLTPWCFKFQNVLKRLESLRRRCRRKESGRIKKMIAEASC